MPESRGWLDPACHGVPASTRLSEMSSPGKPCPAVASTFTRLNHSFIRCLAPPSFLLPPLPTGTAEPSELNGGPSSHLPFSKHVPSMRPNFLGNTQTLCSTVGVSKPSPAIPTRRGVLMLGSTTKFMPMGFPPFCIHVEPAAPSQNTTAPARALPPHPTSAATISQQSTRWPQLPSSSSSPTGRRKKMGITCVPRNPKDGLGVQHIPRRAALPMEDLCARRSEEEQDNGLACPQQVLGQSSG